MNHHTRHPKLLRLLALAFALALVLLWTGGCRPPSALKQDYGNSVRNNIAQQVVYPQAGLDPAPPVGLAPQVGANELDRYSKSFKTEEKKTLEMKPITTY